MKSPVVEIRDLWFSFNEVPVLKGANLTIHQGDFMALLGPNGSGKTTLLKLILGLLKPDRGSIRVFGRAPWEVAHRIGYVPQDVNINKSFPIAVVDVVLMGRLRHYGGWPRYSREDRMAVQRALEQLEVWEYRDHRIGELSGGQRQRIFIARALVTGPDLLLLDEPTASVDTKGQTDFYAILKEINETVTIVVVSHDVGILSSHVKCVACVNEQVYFHDAAEISEEMLEMMTYQCPVELVAHGLPHRVLRKHEDKEDA